ncbi:Hypothetical protein, predicted transmembrane protein [Metamycoplasma auris 15026]|uniref:DUF3899 domain-containing protein n=1 Tax=Metamycoplasma auris 15026 TaxID=1188233 RepID=N9VAQ0_9BACT|nr:hypothetical protein [Metamycoplasma auris]ENY68491.1 Hypothetical protein, predicted transmembrane protein [Metamycoplasma auris 15026]
MQKTKSTFNAKNYWKRSWNLGNILYFFISLFLLLLIILLVGFLKKGNEKRITWSNAITVGCVLIIATAFFVIIAKSGFGKKIFSPLVSAYHNNKISASAKTRYKDGMNQFEKDKILNQERTKYNNELNKKNLEKQKNESTNLASYLLITISVLILIIGVVCLKFA